MNRVNSSNFNATILNFFEKFEHPFSHVFIFGNMLPESHGFVAMPVKAYHRLEMERVFAFANNPQKFYIRIGVRIRGCCR